MLKSMTGFGVVQGKLGAKRVVVETKSVNHKFCEINLRFPPRYGVLEGKVVEFAKSHFSRGRIDVFLKEESHRLVQAKTVIDLKRMKSYHQILTAAAKQLKISDEIRLDTLLHLPQVVILEEEENLETIWKQLLPILKASFASLEKMRLKEGLAISKFFQQQLQSLSKQVQAIQTWVPQSVKLHRQQLLDRIQKLTSNSELDPQRLAQEVAYFVDRSDISEELQRLTHHIVHFKDILQMKDPIGRKLDFLLQEMNREVNTLSAKAQNADVSRRVVECKHLLEKMREQVQNVE